MCTLTWAYHSDGSGYHIHFNRDESRLRKRAALPVLLSERDTAFLAPTDTEANGTWILTNQFGFSACLLNNYIEIKNHVGSRSRGLLVRDLCCAKTVKEAHARFDALNFHDYSPFDIYLFDKNAAVEISWNGEQKTDSEQPFQFKSSSGFDAENVIAGRKAQFMDVELKPEKLRKFHASHHPSKSAYSVCMHRHDARTQSYTEIMVNEDHSTMRYTDGPPCSSELMSPLSIPVNPPPSTPLT